MLITLTEITTPRECAAALAAPIRMEDHAFYVTALPEAAREFARRKLPCIFTERPDEGGTDKKESVYGVDLVICGTEKVCADSWRQEEDFLERLWQRHYGLPWTIARTERLFIRESVMEDLPAFLAMYAEEEGNPDVGAFTGRPEETFYLYIRQQYPLYGYGLWSAVERHSGKVVGRIGIESGESGEPFLAYLVSREFRHQGYAREAGEAVLAYAEKVLEMPYLKLKTSDHNTASQNLAVRLGFRKEKDSGNSYRINLTGHPNQYMI